MPNADLVLEGGGVRGLGTAGAVIRLLEEGYTFQRVAGTSVGAVAAAFVAAGMDAEELRTVMEELELRLIPDRERLGRRLVPGVPMLSEGVSLLHAARGLPGCLDPQLGKDRPRHEEGHHLRRPATRGQR